MLQEELESYKQENEMLLIQLEELNQDVEMLEKQLGSTAAIGDKFAISKGAKPVVNEDEENVGSKELEMATAKLAEQMIMLNKSELELAEQQSKIEQLQTEKAKLNQKVQQLQKVEQEYVQLKLKFEKLQTQSGGDSIEIVQNLLQEKRQLRDELDICLKEKEALEKELDEFDDIQDRLMAERATNEALRRMLDE